MARKSRVVLAIPGGLKIEVRVAVVAELPAGAAGKVMLADWATKIGGDKGDENANAEEPVERQECNPDLIAKISTK